MSGIPAKCVDWKVANSVIFRWWCIGICGRTDGRLCDWWCRVAERYGMWTLVLPHSGDPDRISGLGPDPASRLTQADAERIRSHEDLFF